MVPIPLRGFILFFQKVKQGKLGELEGVPIPLRGFILFLQLNSVPPDELLTDVPIPFRGFIRQNRIQQQLRRRVPIPFSRIYSFLFYSLLSVCPIPIVVFAPVPQYCAKSPSAFIRTTLSSFTLLSISKRQTPVNPTSW